MSKIDIIIPTYNSAVTIPILIQRLAAWTESTSLQPHFIFVDDASSDKTFDTLNSELQQTNLSYQVIKLAQNYGQHTATATGFYLSNNDFAVTLDDDLQHNPEDIDTLFLHLQNAQADLVYATFSDKKHHALRNLGTRILQSILKRMEGRDYAMVTSFRVMKSSTITHFKNKIIRTHFIDDFLLQSASTISSCNVSHTERAHGKSGYTMKKLLKMFSVILILHSSLPLKIISRLGLFMSLMFFILGCYYIYDKLYNAVEIGFTSLIVAIFFSTGLILFSLGIIGEYIRRIWISNQGLDNVIITKSCRS